MSELPHHSSGSEGDMSAKVYEVDFRKEPEDLEYIKPEELKDVNVVDLFLTQLSHPGAYRRSAELGEYIQRILGGRAPSDMTQKEAEWHARMSGLMLNLEELHPDELDTLLQHDDVSRELEDKLKATRLNANELKEERKALRLLRELRAGVVMGRIETSDIDERWKSLINRLVSS